MSFATDIQLMMHGFGDCRKPLPETAAVIECIVLQQMTSLLNQASEIGELHGSRSVAAEDILFVMRKDPVKLQRLINYMGVRDLYHRASAYVSGNELAEFQGVEQSRKKICINFLQSIDQTGEYEALCSGSLYDPVKADRNSRLDYMSQTMNGTRYKEFCEARRASFCPRLRVNKFRDWLINEDNSDIKLSQLVLEMLNFLAYETVAQIVDLSLLVKRDASGHGDILSRMQVPAALNPDYPSVLVSQGGILQSGVDTNKDVKIAMDPITPSEVREAIRRYWSNNSPLSPFSKISSPLHTRLLAG